MFQSISPNKILNFFLNQYIIEDKKLKYILMHILIQLLKSFSSIL